MRIDHASCELVYSPVYTFLLLGKFHRRLTGYFILWVQVCLPNNIYSAPSCVRLLLKFALGTPIHAALCSLNLLNSYSFHSTGRGAILSKTKFHRATKPLLGNNLVVFHKILDKRWTIFFIKHITIFRLKLYLSPISTMIVSLFTSCGAQRLNKPKRGTAT